MVFVGLITDSATIFLDIRSDVALRFYGKYFIRIILTSWWKCSFVEFKVLMVLSVPGVVAVLLVGRTSFTISPYLTSAPIYITGYIGPECCVTAE